jgi:KTSC domain
MSRHPRSLADSRAARRRVYNRSIHFDRILGAQPRRRPIAMEMKRLSGGNLRAAGYDDKNRMLVVELSSGTFQYTGVTAETWRRFAGASSPWSFFRDNIDEEYPAKRIR